MRLAEFLAGRNRLRVGGRGHFATATFCGRSSRRPLAVVDWQRIRFDDGATLATWSGVIAGAVQRIAFRVQLTTLLRLPNRSGDFLLLEQLEFVNGRMRL